MRREPSGFSAAVARHGISMLAVVVLACCRAVEEPGAAAGEQAAPSRSSTMSQRVRDLEAALPSADVQLDPVSGRVTAIQGLDVRAAAAAPEDIARSVLRVPVVGAALGVSSDLRELCSATSRRDAQLENRAVVRMSQCMDGVKVLGAELVMSVKLAPSPSVASLTSSLVADLPKQSTPKLSAADAVKAARAAVTPPAAASPGTPRAEDDGPPELVIFAPRLFQLDGPTRLCWSVRVRQTIVLVDADSGAIVQRYSAVAQ